MNKFQRHLGRELALQWLFELDLGRQPTEDVLAHLPDASEEWFERVGGELKAEGIDFARALVRGFIGDQQQTDAVIEQYAKGWTIERMAGVERNVLRLAVAELRHISDVPASVSIAEAVQLAKRYGADDAGKFVNGILGAYVRNEMEGPQQA